MQVILSRSCGLEHLGDDTRADGLTTLTERETEDERSGVDYICHLCLHLPGTDLTRNVVVESADHLDVVPGHNHLLLRVRGALGPR